MRIKTILLTIVCALCTLPAWATTFTVGDFQYETIDASTCKLDRYTGAGGAITIPATASDGSNTYSVTTIGESAFTYCSGLTSVTIPNSVTTIGNYAFEGCANLTSVTVEAVAPPTLGAYAFGGIAFGCTLTVPSGSESAYAASDWSNYFTFAGVPKTWNCGPGGSASVVATLLNNTLTISGTGPMEDYTGQAPWRNSKDRIASVVIENGVTSIGNGAFEVCYNMTSVTIGNSVTTIGYNAFVGCRSLTSVTIPNSVTTIGNYTFSSCTSLTSVTIPNSVTTIEQYAFSFCYSLASVTIPSGVTAIGDRAFDGCSSLASVTSDAVAPPTLGTNVFANIATGCTLTVPSGSESAYAASDWSNYFTFAGVPKTWNCGPGGSASVVATLSNGTLTISGSGAMEDFAGQAPWYNDKGSITSAVIENGVTSIGGYAFENCSSLTSVTIPSSVTTIGNYAFTSCTGLTSVAIPNSVTTIGILAFAGCSSLPSVTIPSGVTRIEDRAFDGCSSLTSVTSDAVTPPFLSSSAFGGIAAGCTLTVPSGSENAYAASDWKLYFIIAGAPQTWNCGPGGSASVVATLSGGTLTISGTGEMEENTFSFVPPWYAYKGTITDAVISNGVTTIGGYTFRDCANLTSFTIPNSVTTVGVSAFRGSGLTSVTIPNSVTTIWNAAFEGSNLTSVTIPNSVTTLGNYVFYECGSLASVTIGNSVTTIGSGDFYGCSSLASVTVEAVAPPTISTTSAFYGIASGATLTVPAGSESAYAASDWSNYFTIAGAPQTWNCGPGGSASVVATLSNGTLTISGTGAMEDYTSSSLSPWYSIRSIITSAVIENGVTSIGGYAFYDCTGLTSVTIPNSVTTIGNYAFTSCTSLTSVAIPNSVTTIGNVAFRNCTSLTSITIPNSVTTIGELAFYDCNSLISVFIPNSVTTIERSVFSRCTSLTSVTIPNSVTTIEVSAFNACTSLTSIEIPNLVTTIELSAFANCTGLTSVTIPNSVTTIGSWAFSGCSSLASVTSLATAPPTLGTDVFDDIASGATLTVPAGSESAYAASDWGNWFTIAGIPTLSVAPATLNFASAGSTTTVAVTSNVSWTAVSDAAWLTVAPASGNGDGTLTVTASANASASSRTATITVSGGGINRAIAVTQLAPALTVSSSTLNFDATASTKPVAVSSGVSWTAGADVAWITVTPASGTNYGSIAVTVAANTSTSPRTGVVTVSGGGISCTIDVTQAAAAAPTLTVAPATLNFVVDGGTTSISVTSDVAWTVSDNAAWISFAPASGNGNGTIAVTASANTSTSPRTATITVSGGGIDRTIAVTQAPVAPTLTVAPATLDFATAGGAQEVNVASNSEWTAEGDAPWLTVTKVSDAVLRITAVANTGYARTGSVTVTAGGLTQEVSVEQEAAQQIIADPKPPVDNQGSIEIALEIPVNEEFNITFTVTLPVGFVLDQQATSLTADLLSRYQLSITPDGQGGWLFSITPRTSVRSAADVVYQKVVDIVYTTPATVQPGNYEVKLQDVDLTTAGGTTVHQNEIAVPVTVTNTTGNGLAIAAQPSVWYAAGILSVNTPPAERITVCSISGIAVCQAGKDSGAAAFNLKQLSRGIYVVSGSSGWVKKIVVH